MLLRDRELLTRDARRRSERSRSASLFDLVVLDESQRIKNRASSTSRAGVLDTAQAELGADGHAGREQRRKTCWASSSSSAPGFLSPEMKPRSMGHTIRDYVLRRTKDQVLRELPPKLIHDDRWNSPPSSARATGWPKSEGMVRLSALGEGATIRHVFELVLRLKQICNFDPATGASSKLERLEADLEEIADSGRKAIVFSQWVGHAPAAGRAARSGSARWNTTAACRRPAATASSRASATTPAGTSS